MYNMRSVCMPDILLDLHIEAALADVGIKPQLFNQLGCCFTMYLFLDA